MIGEGTTLGSYTIIRPIRRGGSTGDLFLAEHRTLGRRVVVEVLAPALSRRGPALQRFCEDLRGAAMLEHPGIATVLDYGEVDPASDVADGAFYVTLELRDGETLSDHLARGTPGGLDLPFVVRMGAAMARALGEAHGAGIVHGALSPECVYLSRPDAGGVGEMRIFDFGLGKLLQAAEKLPGSAMASVGPMTPERVRGARDVDARTDVYGLGTILYEALCGRPPFTQAASGERLLAILMESPAPPSTHAPGVPPGLDALVLAMLSKDPDQRPRAMADVASALETCLREASRRIDENVQFTVRRPKLVPPGQWQKLLVFAHLAQKRADAPAGEPDPVEEVERQSEQMLGVAASEFARTTTDSKGAVPEKGELTILPLVPGVEFNPPRIAFLWMKPVHGFSFDFRASAELDGKTARGAVHVFLGPMILADIAVAIPVDSKRAEAGRADEHARPYRKIFASYSHKDRAIVEGVKNHVGSLGDRYLMDCVDLRAGEVWTEGIARLINDADVFQLFWSWNALRSAYVRKEWEYALSLGGSHLIRPTYWEDPLPEEAGLPPAPLKRLHFQRISIAGDQQPGPRDMPKTLFTVGAPASRSTTLSGAASVEAPTYAPRPRRRAALLLVPAAAVSLAALVAVSSHLGGGPSVAPPSVGVSGPTSAPTSVPTSSPHPPIATVRIDVRGLPPGTNVKIDGFVAELPVVVPRGTDKHQIVLEEPSAKGKRVKRELAVVALKDVNLSLEDFALAKEEPPPEAASHKRSRPKKGGDPDGLATPVF